VKCRGPRPSLPGRAAPGAQPTGEQQVFQVQAGQPPGLRASPRNPSTRMHPLATTRRAGPGPGQACRPATGDLRSGGRHARQQQAGGHRCRAVLACRPAGPQQSPGAPGRGWRSAKGTPRPACTDTPEPFLSPVATLSPLQGTAGSTAAQRVSAVSPVSPVISPTPLYGKRGVVCPYPYHCTPFSLYHFLKNRGDRGDSSRNLLQPCGFGLSPVSRKTVASGWTGGTAAGQKKGALRPRVDQ
jgi:hypothetical protein